MAVEAVPGYGQITKANAPMIYRDRKVYDKLSEDQKHLVERYIPDEQKDEIDYEIRKTNGKQNGKDKIEDNKRAEAHKGQGWNAAGTSIGGAASAASGAIGMYALKGSDTSFQSFSSAKTSAGGTGGTGGTEGTGGSGGGDAGSGNGADNQKVSKDGQSKSGNPWTALIQGAIVLASGLLTRVFTNKFDNGYKDRTASCDNAGSTNDTIDTQANALQSSMDMMDQDVQEYLEGSKELMKKTNDNNSKLGDLQVQYADCQAAGDTAGAERLKAQIKERHEVTFDQDQEKLDEKKKGLDDYRIMSDESDGVIEGGTNVSEFLKQGKALGVVATVNAVLYLAATVITAVAGAKALASGTFPWEKIVAIAAAALYIAGLACMTSSAVEMGKKAKKEFECGSAGNDMEGHVNALAEMKDAQSTYTDETEETYTEEDEQRTETVEEGEEMANGNSTSNRGQVITYKPYGQDDDDKGPNGKKKKGKNKAGAKA